MSENKNFCKPYKVYSKDEYKSWIIIAAICSLYSFPLLFRREWDFSYTLYKARGGSVLIALYGIYNLVKFLKVKDNHIVFLIDQEGIQMERDNGKMLYMPWEIIESANFGTIKNDKGEKKFRLIICTTFGRTITFSTHKYVFAINPYKLRKALRYFSGRDDFGKSPYPLFLA